LHGGIVRLNLPVGGWSRRVNRPSATHVQPRTKDGLVESARLRKSRLSTTDHPRAPASSQAASATAERPTAGPVSRLPVGRRWSWPSHSTHGLTGWIRAIKVGEFGSTFAAGVVGGSSPVSGRELDLAADFPSETSNHFHFPTPTSRQSGSCLPPSPLEPAGQRIF
jgi:hypothetical protein